MAVVKTTHDTYVVEVEHWDIKKTSVNGS